MLLVSIDTLRRDHVSAYGHARPTTPGIDRLAREGALFERAVSSSNWTLPAHMSLLTGLSPGRHRVEDERDRLPQELRSLAESFRDAGYATAGFASHVYLDARYGFARGFDRFELDPERRAAEVSERAVAWLERHADGPFFLFLHYFDPHWDYDPPEPFRRRFGSPPREAGLLSRLYRYQDPELDFPPQLLRDATALYDAEIAYTDAALSRVLDRLRERRRLDDTVVAVLSDHGEEFGEHRGFGHGSHLHGELSSIPLVLRFPPRIAAGTRRADLVGLVDLPATLLALAGRTPEDQFRREGRALFEVAPDAERSLVVESTRNGPRRLALHRGDHVLLGAGSYRPIGFERRGGKLEAFEGAPLPLAPALFDVAQDPGEVRNRLHDPEFAGLAQALREALRGYAEETASGLLLACGPEAGAEISGRVGFERPLRDQPYGIDPEGRARTRELSPTQFEVALEPAGREATLVFPTPIEPGSVRLALGDGDAEVVQSVPPPGQTARYGACRLESRGVAPAESERVELGEEERARLRALGYVESPQ